MAQQFRVQPGHTTSSIAKQFNVPISAVSGFRSNDPNTIFPGEILTIDTGQALTPQTPQRPQAPLQAPQSPFTPVDPDLAVTPPTAPPVAPQATPEVPVAPTAPQQPVAPTAPEVAVTPTPTIEPEPEVDIETPDIVADAVAEDEVEAVDEATEQARNFFGQFGVSSDALSEGFQTNPFGTLSELVSQVMEATGLPGFRDDITSIANNIAELEADRDAEIDAVKDDPFLSAGSKAKRIDQIENKFERRINTRTNRLAILQDAQQQARQQAQFAASTAIDLFGQQQRFQQDQLENILDERERILEARTAAQERAFEEQLERAGLSLEERRVALAERKEAREARTGIGAGVATGISPITGKPFTQEQSKAGLFASRTEAADTILDRGKGRFLPFAPEIFKTQERKAFEQAERNFITAILRRESGAAISETEFADARRVFIPLATV